MPKKGKKLDEKLLNQYMDAYSKKTPEAFLDDAFSKWDAISDTFHAAHLPYLDRADHIIINGRTATELLTEQFSKESPKKDSVDYPRLYGDFYKKNAKSLINQMVSTAMMNGEKVEVFVPDRVTGEIPKEPKILTPQGYQPSGPLAKPAQMTRWQKFWSKFGFYKKEKAAVTTYEQKIAVRKKVQFCNRAARANLATNASMHGIYNEEIKQYASDIFEDMQKNYPAAKGDPSELPEVNGYKFQRSSFHSLALCVLASKRNDKNELMYSNEKLFDIADENMRRARADAAREVYEHYKKGDTKWLFDLQVEASKVLPERTNIQAAKLNFAKPDLTEQRGYREFSLLCDTAFDQSQDTESVMKQTDLGTYLKVSGALGAFPRNGFREIGEALSSQRHMLNGIVGTEPTLVGQSIGKVIFGQAIRQQIAEAQKNNPKAKFTEVADPSRIPVFTTLVGQLFYDESAMDDPDEPEVKRQIVKLTQERLQNPNQINEQIVSGVFQNRIQLKKYSIEKTDTEPFKFDVKNAKTVEREMNHQQRDTASAEL